MDENKPGVCDYEGSDYQQRFWENADRQYEDQVEAIAIRRLLPPGGKCLLEVGAGAGRNTPRYAGFEKIVLLDYSATQLQQAQERLGRGDNLIFVAADVYRLPFAPGVFDAATMIRTLHHMAEPELALGEVRQSLASHAYFLLEYANKRNLKAIARYLLRRQDWNPFDRQPVEFAALNFDFHPAAVRGWLNNLGFDIERQLTVSHFRLPLLKKLLPLRWLVGLDAQAQLSGDLWQFTPSVFVGMRVPGDPPIEPAPHFWRCPACRSLDLTAVPAGLQCVGCGATWALRDGIYDFKTPLNKEA